MIRSCAVVGALGLATLAASVFVASSPSYADSPYSHQAVLSVSPPSQLLPGAQVNFAGSGFPPGLALRLEECDANGPILNSGCTAIADSLFLSGPDGSVNGSATIVSGPVGTASDSNCPVAADQASHGQSCVIALTDTGGSGWYAAAAISFSSSVPVPADAPPTTTPTSTPAPEEKTPSIAPASGGPVADGTVSGRRAAEGTVPDGTVPDGTVANRTKLADARKAVPGSAPNAPSRRGGPFGWPVWLAVMAFAAAGTGAVRAARVHRRHRRAPVPTGR